MGVRGIRRKGNEPIKMNVESILHFAKNKGFVGEYNLDIEQLVIDNKIEIKRIELPPEISGKLYMQGDSWIIEVNKNHSPNRQRYTIAHEFAHYCLHKNANQTFEDTAFFRKDENKTSIEYEANQFAAELLMPEEKIKEAIESDLLELKQLADHFKVSLIAMKNRLINLGYKLIGDE
ncbi:ImmA/IrrE family metallo-endopeptidase [uncultured Bacteroides sp.]|uniref:ImmA/IrrE family metallo-endopeptidase n=1 Tax=uncultured Bacteroides sp. TaxID=162156 RepID=UPI002AAAA089|nr:ImmA/IrrE family metallo-endopeptidase [uncultured Bacteroides sp.]